MCGGVVLYMSKMFVMSLLLHVGVVDVCLYVEDVLLVATFSCIKFNLIHSFSGLTASDLVGEVANCCRRLICLVR